MTSPVGILSSRIGYSSDEAIRVLVRGPAGTVPAGGCCRLHGPLSVETKLEPWGARWGSQWWIATFAPLPVGSWQVICDLDSGPRRGDPITVADDVLWERCWQAMAIGMPQRRARIAKVKPGWYDAGNLWQEVNAHASMVLGLCDVLEYRGEGLGEERALVVEQVVVGLSYLGMCQDAAAGHGHAAGALCHDLVGHEKVCIPGDMAKAAVAWARGARIAAVDQRQAETWRARAASALTWFADGPRLGAFGFAAIANGVAEDWQVPDLWRSEDLAMRLWAATELARSDLRWLDQAAELARELRRRQIPQAQAEDGLWGHQYTFGSSEGPTQKAWTHCFHGGMGQDLGNVFPFWVLPLIDLHRTFPHHPEAAMWHDQVSDLAYGFLLPACRRNPFGICPMGVWPGEGLLDFGAMWHGGNAVYGYTAAQCFELAHFLDDPAFAELARGNLQWLAGCNAGITSASALGCHLVSCEVPEGLALPASMVCGIGDRSAGCWLNIRGSICNGFATGAQFVFDVPPARASDGPHSLTDEDWITHTGAFLSGVARAAQWSAVEARGYHRSSPAMAQVR